MRFFITKARLILLELLLDLLMDLHLELFLLDLLGCAFDDRPCPLIRVRVRVRVRVRTFWAEPHNDTAAFTSK